MDETIPPGLDESLDTIGPVAAFGGEVRPSAPGVLAGAVVTVGLHVFIIALLAGLHALPRTSAADRLTELREAMAEQPRALSARLVKLGSRRNRRRLPTKRTRQVRALAPDDRAGTPADIAVARSGKAPEKIQERTEQVTDEDLARTLERAKILAQVGDVRSAEGSPEGVRGGEIGPDEARPLDLYVTLLHRMIRQRWSTSVAPEELAGLRSVVSMRVNRDLTVGAVSMVRPSGNATFDSDALAAVRRFKREVRTLPPPPDEEVANAVFARPITIRFRGRDLR